ncbi:hypothetical protein ACP70R_042119 [Stipagrostis hirtigluma subsp. patula]
MMSVGVGAGVLLRLVARDIFFIGILVCVLDYIYSRLTASRAIHLARSTGDAARDDIAAATPESEKSIVVGSDAATCIRVQSGSSFVPRLVFKISRGAGRWSNTFRLDGALGQPIEQVTRRTSQEIVGQPMKQRMAGWVDVEELDELYTLDVDCLGVPLANPLSQAQTVLPPLCLWTKHQRGGDYGLSPDRVAKLLDAGPCVGSLWVCPWYSYFIANGDKDDAWVYRGCGRNQGYKNDSKRLYGDEAGQHAIVCIGYRVCGDGQMHVLVMDNQTTTGPRRRVDIYRDVDCLGVPLANPPSQAQIVLYKIWEVCQPIKQRKKGTCAIAACIAAVEAMHRRKYAKVHVDHKRFPLKAAKPHELLEVCRKKGIWTPDEGAYVGDVLKTIQEEGGVLTTNGERLQLPWTQKHNVAWLSSDRVAELLDNGPCVATLWTCPWYYWFYATSHNDTWVYRGCGRSQAYRDESKRLYPGKVGSHAVLCIGYRVWDHGQMDVLVLDNHTATGPLRWVDVEELDELHTVSMECPDPPR